MLAFIASSFDAPHPSVSRVLDARRLLAAVREQVAVVRAMMDEVDRFAGDPELAPRAQLAEEMARLERSAIAAASALSGEGRSPVRAR
jgi:hypothetical protein